MVADTLIAVVLITGFICSIILVIGVIKSR